MLHAETAVLRDWLQAGSDSPRLFSDAGAGVSINALAGGSCLGGRLSELRGRSVILSTRSQLAAALAMIELDGVARRITLCPADFDPAHATAVIATAEADALVSDHEPQIAAAACLPVRVLCGTPLAPGRLPGLDRVTTQWILLTSGTTGVPKLVKHSLASLIAPIRARPATDAAPVVWGTFYDIRRYGGLQIFLRAVLGDASFVLASAGEAVADHLGRLARHGVTHLSGTPSHWRRALMSPAARTIAPRYVRLSGEIADQAILDSLRTFFPGASVGHAYASTEAGVGFEVDDGLAGFPAEAIGAPHNGVELKIVDGALRLRSPRAARGYLGSDGPLADPDGFVDTGDIVELRGGRYYFVGRRGGIINVGGQKVHPEEVEAVINRHPRVRMSLVRARKNPITGSIVIADVVLATHSEDAGMGGEEALVRREILELCRDRLALHKVPAAISFVPALAVAASGKLARPHA